MYYLVSPFVLLLALSLAVPASAQTASRVASGDGLELAADLGTGPTVIARHDGAAWTRTAELAPLRSAGSTSPVEVVISGLAVGVVFATCDGVTVAGASAVEGSQVLDVPGGDCAVGVLSVFNDDATMALVVRETPVPATGPIELHLDGPLSTATTVLRDETGATVVPANLDRLMSFDLFTGPPRPHGGPFRISVAGTLPPANTETPTYRYSVPDGLDYRMDWSLRSWQSATTRYHFKGRLDDFASDRTMENTTADLGRTVVDYDLSESVGALRGNMTWTAYDRSGTGIPIEKTNWFVCNPPLLPPPHVQRVYEMPDPADDFMVREGQFDIVLDETNELWDPASDNPASPPCGELEPGDKYTVSTPLVHRAADGVTRSFVVEREAGAGVVLGDTLRHGLAPLAFTPRIQRDVGGVYLQVGESRFVYPPLWPLGAFIGAPLVDAQHGDARPEPMPFEIRDAAGGLVLSGPDLTAVLAETLPEAGRQISGRYTDPVVRVGGMPAEVEVALDYSAGAADPGPPYLKRLTLQFGGAYTATVPVGAGTLRLGVGDADGVVATVEAAVRPSKGAWLPLPLTPDGAGAYRSELDLEGGVYDLRIVATDAAGHAARYLATPAFEVAGVVAAEAAPGPGWLGVPAPNPASTHVDFVAELDAPEALRAELYDALGRRVRVAETACAAGPCALRLEVQALPPGVYLARLSAGARQATRRLTVAR